VPLLAVGGELDLRHLALGDVAPGLGQRLAEAEAGALRFGLADGAGHRLQVGIATTGTASGQENQPADGQGGQPPQRSRSRTASRILSAIWRLDERPSASRSPVLKNITPSFSSLPNTPPLMSLATIASSFLRASFSAA